MADQARNASRIIDPVSGGLFPLRHWLERIGLLKSTRSVEKERTSRRTVSLAALLPEGTTLAREASQEIALCNRDLTPNELENVLLAGYRLVSRSEYSGQLRYTFVRVMSNPPLLDRFGLHQVLPDAIVGDMKLSSAARGFAVRSFTARCARPLDEATLAKLYDVGYILRAEDKKRHIYRFTER